MQVRCDDCRQTYPSCGALCYPLGAAPARLRHEPDRHACARCSQTFAAGELGDPVRALAGLSPGDLVPSGICPRCDWFCYPVGAREAFRAANGRLARGTCLGPGGGPGPGEER
jgi:hypothetical protein